MRDEEMRKGVERRRSCRRDLGGASKERGKLENRSLFSSPFVGAREKVVEILLQKACKRLREAFLCLIEE